MVFEIFYFSEITYGASYCTERYQCITPDAICLNAHCTCDQNRRFFKDNACVPSKFLVYLLFHVHFRVSRIFIQEGIFLPIFLTFVLLNLDMPCPYK